MSDLSTKPSVSVPGSMDSSEEESATSDGLEKPNSKPPSNSVSHSSEETTRTAVETTGPPPHLITPVNDTHQATATHQPVRSKPEPNKTGGGVFQRVLRPSQPTVQTTDVTPKHTPGLMKSGDSISPTSTMLTPDSEKSEWTTPPAQGTSRPPSVKSRAEPSSRKSSFSRADDAQHPLLTLQPPSSKAPSTAGSDHGGHRFTLKDLLANGPKKNRRFSASSRKSDASSDRAGTDAQSTTSLLKKYGVCDRVAIGKGATSVVRLAHKWDRSEEKLYAVKVSAVPR